MAWLNFTMPNQTVKKNGLKAKKIKLHQVFLDSPFALNNFFFGTDHYYYFHLPTGSFHCAKFKKILTADPELMTMCHFWAHMVHLPPPPPPPPPPPKKNLIINIILIYLLAPSIMQNFNKILPANLEL